MHLIIQQNGESIQSYIKKGLSEINFVVNPIPNGIPILYGAVSDLQDESNDSNNDSDRQNFDELIDLIDKNLENNSIFSEDFNQTVLDSRNINIINNAFTKEEDDLIFNFFIKNCLKWFKISSFFKMQKSKSK